MAEQSGGGRPDLPALLALATQLAKDASALLVDGLTRARSQRDDQVDRRPTWSPRWTGPPRRSSSSGIRSARPDDGIVGEEGTADVGTSRRPLGDRPDRRHHQLPLRAARLRRVDRGRGRRRRGGRGGRRPGARRAVHRDEGRRREPATAAASACPRSPTSRRRSSAPGSATTRRADAGRQRVLMQVIPEVRDIRRFGAARSTCASSLRAGSTRYYEKGLSPGTSPPASSSPARPGATARRPRRRGSVESSSCSLAAPRPVRAAPRPARPCRSPRRVSAVSALTARTVALMRHH